MHSIDYPFYEPRATRRRAPFRWWGTMNPRAAENSALDRRKRTRHFPPRRRRPLARRRRPLAGRLERRGGRARPSPAALPSEPRVRQCSPQWQASDLRTATTRRDQRGGGRGELHISDTGWPHRQWAWLARRLASMGERPGRAPRPASTPSGACAASRRSARTGLMSVPCDLRSLRTSSSSAWRRQPTTMAANLMPRQTQPRLCPAVPRRSAPAHASLDDGAALLPAARCSAIDHVVHGAADHPRAWAPLRCTGVLPCPAPQRAVHSATRPHCARLWRTVSSLAFLRWRGGASRD